MTALLIALAVAAGPEHVGASDADRLLLCARDLFGKHLAFHPETRGLEELLPCPPSMRALRDRLEASSIAIYETDDWAYLVPSEIGPLEWDRLQIETSWKRDGYFSSGEPPLTGVALPNARIMATILDSLVHEVRPLPLWIPFRATKGDARARVGITVELVLRPVDESARLDVWALVGQRPGRTRLVRAVIAGNELGVVWDSVLLPSDASTRFQDVDGDGEREIVVHAYCVPVGDRCLPGLSVVDARGAEMTRGNHCAPGFLCPLTGNEIGFDWGSDSRRDIVTSSRREARWFSIGGGRVRVDPPERRLFGTERYRLVDGHFELIESTRPTGMSEKEIRRRFREEYCRVLDDDYENRIASWYDELEASGERGRRMLLDVARSRRDEDRTCAWDYLASFGDERVIAILKREVESSREDPAIVGHALRSLHRLGETADASTLFARLDEGDPELVPHVIRSLDLVNDDGRFARFQRYLDDAGPNAWVAIEPLGAIDDDRARAMLRRAALQPALAKYWRRLLDALEKQRDPEALDTLKRMAAEPDLYLEDGPGVGSQVFRLQLARASAAAGTDAGIAHARELFRSISLADPNVVIYEATKLLRVLVDVRSPAAIALARGLVERVCAIHPRRCASALTPVNELLGEARFVESSAERAAMMALYLELTALIPQTDVANR